MLLIKIAAYVLLPYLVANIYGRSRHIGFGWSLVVCLLFSPLIGFPLTLSSAKADKPMPPRRWKYYAGIALMTIAIGFSIYAILNISTTFLGSYNVYPTLLLLCYLFAAAALGRYLIQASAGAPAKGVLEGPHIL